MLLHATYIWLNQIGRITNDLLFRIASISLLIFAIELVFSLPVSSKISFILGHALIRDTSAHDGGPIYTVKVIERTLTDLIQYALEKINDERSKLHLPLLKLSDNKALLITHILC